MKYVNNTNFNEMEQITFPVAMTIGNFDGVHLGHQKIIREMQNHVHSYTMHDMRTLVLSFYPHPLTVLKGSQTLVISSGPEKCFLLKEMGVDMYIEMPFHKGIVGKEPACFAEETIFRKFKCKSLFIGEDYRFGRDRQGDVDLLKKVAAKYGATVNVTPPLQFDSEKISSTGIRQFIMNKNFEQAAKQMGRPYFIMGEIGRGQEIGRKIGFPTVNLLTPPEKLLPPNGVYLTKTYYQGHMIHGVTNIGTKPTVTQQEEPVISVETYLLNFSKSIYGKEIRVYFYEWVRNEMKFRNIADLKTQIGHDVEKARYYFQKADNTPDR